MSLRNRIILILVVFLTASAFATAAEIKLTALTLREGTPFNVGFAKSSRAPGKASMAANLNFRNGQAVIDLEFRKMEPAVLFSGDITTYILWAVSPDNTVDNLGEVRVEKKASNGSQKFYTSKKIIALVLTAEPHSAVRRPTEIVLFTSGEVRIKNITNTPFTFNDFSSGSKPALDSIAVFQYNDDTPAAYRQAKKVLEMALAMDAAAVKPEAMNSAGKAFAEAEQLARSRGNKNMITEQSKLAVQFASQAIVETMRIKEAKAAEEAEAKRLAERAALEARASTAETEAQKIAQQLKEVEDQRAALALESKTLANDLEKLASEKKVLAAERDKIAAERDVVAADRESIKTERDELAGMLRGALSTVAETNDTARGVIVSLPGILFDVNKATLTLPARLTVAKLAGILMVFQNMDLSIEGYTDSTGTDEINMTLSSERAKAVYDFLKAQGITESRMKYQGFGSANPVAPNDTTQNRAKNRRVEVVLTQVKKK